VTYLAGRAKLTREKVVGTCTIRNDTCLIEMSDYIPGSGKGSGVAVCMPKCRDQTRKGMLLHNFEEWILHGYYWAE
jgi:hypothetical protein